MVNLSKKERSWVAYDLANSAFILIMTTTIFQLYFKEVLTIIGIEEATSTAYWGYTNSIVGIVVAGLAIFLGAIADYKGLKKKFFAFFCIMGVLSTFLLAFVPEQLWFLLIILYIFAFAGFAGSNIFYDAFLIDIANEDRMDKVSTAGFAWGYIGSTVPFIICLVIVQLATKEIIPINIFIAYRISFIITALWWGGFSIPMLRNVHQIHGIEMEKRPVVKSIMRIIKTFKDIKKHKAIFLFLLAYFFYIDGVDTIIKMSSSYGSDLGVDKIDLLLILLATQFVAFPCALIFGKLSEIFKGKKMLYVGIGIYVFICIYAYFLDSTFDFWVLAMLVATSQGGIQALSRSYFGKLLPKEKSNEFFGFYNIFGKFATVLGPILLGVIAQSTGETNKGVFSVAILFLIGGFILTKVPEVKEE